MAVVWRERIYNLVYPLAAVRNKLSYLDKDTKDYTKAYFKKIEVRDTLNISFVINMNLRK